MPDRTTVDIRLVHRDEAWYISIKRPLDAQSAKILLGELQIITSYALTQQDKRARVVFVLAIDEASGTAGDMARLSDFMDEVETHFKRVWREDAKVSLDYDFVFVDFNVDLAARAD